MKKVKLGDVATYINGYAFKPNDWGNSGLPIIRIQDLTGTSSNPNYYNGKYPDKIEINNGDILISWSASLGVFLWNKGKALLNQHIFKVQFDKIDINKSYFIYAVKSNLNNFISKAHGATMKHIVKNDFNNIEIPLPSLEEQQHIAAVLDEISELISMRREQLQKLDLLVKARFVEMFGTYPNNEKKWGIFKIQDVVSNIHYGTSRPAIEGGAYSYLRMNNITYNGELNLADIKQIDIPDKELNNCLVQYGDVLFNRTNSKELVGKTCVYDIDTPMILAGFIIRIRVNMKKILPEFLSAFLNTDFSKQMLLEMSKSAIGQANINATELKNIKIYVPPIQIQNNFVQLKSHIKELKSDIQRSLDHLETLKKSKMQEYFG